MKILILEIEIFITNRRGRDGDDIISRKSLEVVKDVISLLKQRTYTSDIIMLLTAKITYNFYSILKKKKLRINYRRFKGGRTVSSIGSTNSTTADSSVPEERGKASGTKLSRYSKGMRSSTAVVFGPNEDACHSHQSTAITSR